MLGCKTMTPSSEKPEPSEVSSVRPWVGQNVALHASSAARSSTS